MSSPLTSFVVVAGGQTDPSLVTKVFVVAVAVVVFVLNNLTLTGLLGILEVVARSILEPPHLVLRLQDPSC